MLPEKMLRSILLNGLLLVISVFAALELAGFWSVRIKPDLYDYSPKGMARMEKRGEKGFNDYIKKLSSKVAGWKNVAGTSFSRDNCNGTSIIYTNDDFGARTYKGYR